MSVVLNFKLASTLSNRNMHFGFYTGVFCIFISMSVFFLAAAAILSYFFLEHTLHRNNTPEVLPVVIQPKTKSCC
jgi:hypothetical protein